MGLFNNRKNAPSDGDDAATLMGSDSVDLSAMADLWDMPPGPNSIGELVEAGTDTFDGSPTSLFDSPQRRRSTDQLSQSIDDEALPTSEEFSSSPQQPPLPPPGFGPSALPQPASADDEFEPVDLTPAWFEHTNAEQSPQPDSPTDMISDPMPFVGVIPPEVAETFEQRQAPTLADFDAAFADARLPRADAEPVLPPAPRRRSDLGVAVTNEEPSPPDPIARKVVHAGNIELDEHGLLEMLGLPVTATFGEVGAAHRRFMAEHDPAAEEDESSRNLQHRIRREANTAYATYRLVKAG